MISLTNSSTRSIILTKNLFYREVILKLAALRRVFLVASGFIWDLDLEKMSIVHYY